MSQINIRVKHQTDKAILVTNPDDEECWIPKSQIEFPDDQTTPCELIVEFPDWLVEKHALV